MACGTAADAARRRQRRTRTIAIAASAARRVKSVDVPFTAFTLFTLGSTPFRQTQLTEPLSSCSTGSESCSRAVSACAFWTNLLRAASRRRAR